jgi:DNA-binding MarR family transcriptional regulator
MFMGVYELRTPAEHLLGSRARVRVLEALLVAPGTVSELARAAQCAKSAVSTALRQLRAASIVEQEADRYTLAPAHRALVEQLVHLSPAPTQEELFREYIGRWVALSQTGDVVDSDDDPEALATRLRQTAADVHAFRHIPDPRKQPSFADAVWCIE